MLGAVSLPVSDAEAERRTAGAGWSRPPDGSPLSSMLALRKVPDSPPGAMPRGGHVPGLAFTVVGSNLIVGHARSSFLRSDSPGRAVRLWTCGTPIDSTPGAGHDLSNAVQPPLKNSHGSRLINQPPCLPRVFARLPQ